MAEPVYGPVPGQQQQAPGAMMFGGGGLTPEQLQALMEYGAGQGAWTEQDRAIQQQLAQAVALKNRGSTPYTTGRGAMVGGMADVVNQISGMQQEKRQRAADAVLQQQRIRALQDLAARFRPQQQHAPDPTQDIPPMLARPPGM